MKKRNLIMLFSLLTAFCGQVLSQSGLGNNTLAIISPNGYFDKVYDKDGQEYNLIDLQIHLDRYNSNNTVLVSSSTSCTAGFFNVFYANGSGMESTTIQTHIDRRALVCHLLENISGLLGGWSSWPSNVRVNILVDDITNHGVTTPSVTNVLGLASGFYVTPGNPASSNPGIAENMIEKTIKAKQDAWTNIVGPLNSSGGSGYYHGVIAFNFSHPQINWFIDYPSGLAANSQFDLYSVILHEITHALGFASLISGSGISRFGPANNYYSRYDKFLLDKNNTPLLTSTGCSPLYGLSFNSSTLSLQPNCPTYYSSQITTCTTACKYNSSNVSYMPVFTPNCFVDGSSLSHFEDMCYPTNNVNNNNLYFVMSDANTQGLNKRYLKPEERFVLCDLGYTVSSTYTSNAVGSGTTLTNGVYSINYGSGCSSPNIWGLNDGFNNSVYTYTSVGGAITISISATTGSNSILWNDASSAVTASCVEKVYNNGTVTTNYTLGTITYSPSSGYYGPVLLRYIPVDANNNQGNVTYIYAYVYPSNCIPASACDLVQNGSFETHNSCGSMVLGSNSVNASCWLPYTLSPDIFVKNCWSSSSYPAALGYNTYNSTNTSSNITMPFNSYNGSPNDAIIGLGAVTGSLSLSLCESYCNFLGTPLQYNQVYTLSFWAYQFVGYKNDPIVTSSNLQSFNSYSVPLAISFATSNGVVTASGSNFPDANINVVSSVTLANSFNTWVPYSVTFTYTGGQNGNWLYFGPDKNLSYALFASSTNTTNQNLYYTLFDDISILPVSQSSQFNIPNSAICSQQSFTDLAQYVSVPGGTFTGAGVTNTAGVYYFNYPTGLTNGMYTISYTYSNNINCLKTAAVQVSVGTVYSPATLTAVNNTGCTYGNTLSVTAPTITGSYTWNPGNITSTTAIAVSPTSTTIYTAIGSYSSNCFASGTIQITPNIPDFTITIPSSTVCIGITSSLSALGNFTSTNWNPGNSSSNPYIITPIVNTNYTCTVTNSLGCNASKTINIIVPTYTTNATVSNSIICEGNSTTLSPVGQYTSVTWFPGGITSTVNIVTPSVSTQYTAIISDVAGCSHTHVVPVTVINFNIIPLTSSNMCAGSSSTLSAVGNFTSIVWQPGGLITNSILVTVTPNLIYTATATFSSGCVTTQTFEFGILDILDPQFEISSVYPVICSGNSETLNISSNIINMSSITWTWIPSGISNTSIVVSPSLTTNYSVMISYSLGLCNYNVIRSIVVSTNCCTGTITPMQNMSSSTQTIIGSKVVNGDIFIPSGHVLTLEGEFLFAPNVKITVGPNAVLNISDAHLYACSTEMWTGIDVLDEGRINLTRRTKDNLFEDAITGINVANHVNSNFNPILDVSNTTFNKNYTDISISNYTHAVSNYPFNVESCVFTCRDFSVPVGSNSWPQTGTISAATNTAADLRYTSLGSTTASTVLAPPYLNQGFPIIKLKSPYTDHTSQIAIQINSVGVTSGTNMYAVNIGIGSNAADFNLFDGHVQFIVAHNCNLICINNVFQNTQSYTYTSNFVPGKAAIEHSTNGVMNTKLYMTAANVDVGSRFWNCHIGIQGYNVYSFNLEKAIFRSTQSSTNLPGPLYSPVGGTGICLNTNRFEYYIVSNEFININNSINIPIAVGTFTSALTGSATVTGIYAANMKVVSNTIAPGSITNNYSNNAITISAPFNTPYQNSPTYIPYVAPSDASPFARAIVVSNNNLTNVFRGIYLNGITGFQTAIVGNVVTLKNDGVFTVTPISQYGIKLTNANPTSSLSLGKNIITTNTVGFSTATSTTNVSGSLIFCGNNGYAQSTPSITCNKLTRGYEAFVFDGPNIGTQWAGNTMTTPMARGLVLDHAGQMGEQGSNNFAGANIWSGAWSPTLNTYGTYVGTNSSATNSLLWVKNNSGTLTTFPPANSGTVQPIDQYPSAGTYSISTGGDYTCGHNANNRTWQIPTSGNFVSADQFYISKFALYRFLHFNDSLINADTDLEDFYAEQSSGNIGTFMEIEEKIYLGDLATAASLNAGFDPTNTIEENYSEYYNLCISFGSNEYKHTNADDSTALANFALLCPGTNGACVYQARALYNTVYHQIINDSECESSGAKMTPENNNSNITNHWDVEIFPNPAINQITLVSKSETENLRVIIRDLSGRTLINKNLITNQFFVNLDLSLMSGAYLITILNDQNEKISKKLIISK